MKLNYTEELNIEKDKSLIPKYFYDYLLSYNLTEPIFNDTSCNCKSIKESSDVRFEFKNLQKLFKTSDGILSQPEMSYAYDLYRTISCDHFLPYSKNEISIIITPIAKNIFLTFSQLLAIIIRYQVDFEHIIELWNPKTTDNINLFETRVAIFDNDNSERVIFTTINDKKLILIEDDEYIDESAIIQFFVDNSSSIKETDIELLLSLMSVYIDFDNEQLTVIRNIINNNNLQISLTHHKMLEQYKKINGESVYE